MQNLQVLHLLKAFLIHSSSQKEPAPYTHKQGTLLRFSSRPVKILDKRPPHTKLFCESLCGFEECAGRAKPQGSDLHTL